MLAYLFCDNIAMLIRELFLTHLFPRKIFNLITLWIGKYFQITFLLLKQTI